MAGLRSRGLVVPGVALILTTGCVERRFVIESNVPGAQVFVNNVAVGPSPADSRWEYSGSYEFRLVAPGYEPLCTTRRVPPKWYEYPGLDFFFDAIYPFHIEDVRRFHFDLVPATQVRTDELLDAANQLRERASQLPAPEEPPRPKSAPPAGPQPAPPAVIPVPADLPPTGAGAPPAASGAFPGISGLNNPSLPPRPQ